MRPRVYISGPISKGDRTANFAAACQLQKQLMRLGCAPLNPMLSMLHPEAFTIAHSEWLACDLPWVQVADAVYRLPGESAGADAEVAYAIEHGIPVFYSHSEFVAWHQARSAVA